ncbi:MAG: hypothetical protein KGZ69_03775 [Methylomonas sp.]|nr:hypothetical protein [Methylomonas sp.]
METKKGYKTTEFWLTTLGSILTLLNQSGALGTPLPIEPIMAVLGSISAYTMSRSFTKKDKK